MGQMAADPALDQLSREELVQRARELGARRPEVMTRIELRDEIVRLSEPDPQIRRRSRGWLGVARDLVASVMDAGLNMPGAAAAIRGDGRPAAEETTGPPPVATLTLAEIYLAQGHAERALAVLEEVLAAEPEHAAALELRARVIKERESGARRRPPIVAEPVSEEPSEVPPAPAPFIASVPAPDAVRVPPVVHDFEPSEPTSFREPISPAEQTPAPYAVAVPDLALGPPGPPEYTPASDPAPAPNAAALGELPHIDSAPPSAPIPTMAAPSPRTVVAFEPAVTEPACALAQTGGAVEAHYRLPPGTGHFVMRVAWFVPTHEGPTEGSLDVPLDRALRRVSLPGLEQTAHVRAALGTKDDGAFNPVAVAWVYRVTAGGVKVEFAPPGREPTALRAELGR